MTDRPDPVPWPWVSLLSSLRSRLIALLLLAASPVWLLALNGMFGAYRATVADARGELIVDSDLLASALTGRIAVAEAVLGAIAGSWAPQRDRCGDWLGSAASVGLSLDVLDADLPQGCTAGDAVAVGFAAMPAAPGMIGSMVLSRRLPAPATATLRARIATTMPLAPGRFAWLVGRDGVTTPLSPQTAALGPARFDLPTAVPGTLTLNDDTLLVARASLTPMVDLVVARQAAPVRATARSVALLRLGEIAALLLLSSLAVVLGAKYAVTRPLARLHHAVARWREHGSFELPQGRGVPDELRHLAHSFAAGAGALEARERDLQAAIDRAELLTAEVHHRVKNNLQVITSLLALQAQRVTDMPARAEFETARDRIGALATLHRHMYAHHDPEAIDLAPFIEELGANLFAAVGDRPGRRVTLAVDAPALRISSDQAVPLALIITEALSAALKQGFAGGRRGRIGIRVAADDRRATLAVEDDGAAPRPEDPFRALLLRGLARQLGGTLRHDAAGLTLEFPLRPTTSRPPASIRPTLP